MLEGVMSTLLLENLTHEMGFASHSAVLTTRLFPQVHRVEFFRGKRECNNYHFKTMLVTVTREKLAE